MHCTPPSLMRDRLLDSAEQLVATIGGANLTLEAVAEKAGVSKGGLLYHYRSKEALLLALVHRHLERTDQRYVPGPARPAGRARQGPEGLDPGVTAARSAS